MTETYDLIVIGAGPAGKSAAEVAAGLGRRTLIIEQHQPGGVVTTTGGAPTKTLREAALYLTGFRQEEVYGVRAAVPLDIALPLIGKRTEQVRSALQRVAAEQIAARGTEKCVRDLCAVCNHANFATDDFCFAQCTCCYLKISCCEGICQPKPTKPWCANSSTR